MGAVDTIESVAAGTKTTVPQAISLSASGDVRYYVDLPDGVADTSGDLSIWVRQGQGAYDRTVYDGIAYDNVAASVPTVPEPSTFALAALGLLGLGWFGWRKRK